MDTQKDLPTNETEEEWLKRQSVGAVSKPSYMSLTEDSMKAALIEARGDLFVASNLLRVTALRLDRAIRVSPILQATFLEIKEVKSEYTSLSARQFEEEVHRRLSLYRAVGLDALYDLATMPLNENSAQNQVKLAAAARLAGPADSLSGGGEIGETLRTLNDLYHQHAPRLRVVRERMTVDILIDDSKVVSEQSGQETQK